MRTINADLYMLLHYPLAVFGFLLIACAALLFIHIQFKMRSIGYKTYPLFAGPGDYGLPLKYLRVGSKYGWSPWPAYLIVPCLLIGFTLLIFGILRFK
jgi:hypothetical protein